MNDVNPGESGAARKLALFDDLRQAERRLGVIVGVVSLAMLISWFESRPKPLVRRASPHTRPS